MADTYTTNLNLTKPEVGASTDTWGTKLNADLDTLDAIFSASGTAINLGNVTVASLTTTGDINFGDNDKAIFGAGSDLQIYSDGNSSFINEKSSSGSLFIEGDNIRFRTTDTTGTYALFTSGGSARLYHNNSIKIETTSTGIDVTGTVVSDGLTVDTSTLVVDSTNNRVGIGTASPTQRLDVLNVSRYTFNVDNAYTLQTSLNAAGSAVADSYINAAQHIFQTSATERLRIDSSGRLLAGKTSPGTRNTHTLARTGGFATEILQQQTSSGASVLALQYDGAAPDNTNDYFVYARDTAGIKHTVTANGGAYFAGNVGIGTSSPATALEVKGDGSRIQVSSDDYDIALLGRRGSSGTNLDKGYLRLRSEGVTKAVIDSDFHSYFNGGNVGIGTSSPSHTLHIVSSGNGEIKTERTSGAAILTQAQSALGKFGTSSNHNLQFMTNNTGRVTITTAGRMGIGTSSPAQKLHIGDSGFSYLRTTSASYGGTGCDIGQHTNGSIYLNNRDNTPIIFQTNNTERMRITSAGGVEVGDGTNYGYLKVISDGAVTGYFDRRNSDGTILEFRKDDSSVGSIGAVSGYLYVGGTAGNDAFLSFGADGVRPATSAGAARDAAIDLGGSTNRFKDLHLSGTGYAGNLLVNRTSTLNNAQTSIKGASGKQVLTLQTTTDGNSLIQGFNSSDTLAFQVTGGGGLYASGNVGIGATSVLSGNRLDVRGGNIMVGGFNTGTEYGLILTPSNSSTYWNVANITGGHLTFNNSATIGSNEKMRIGSSGNLLVGKTAANIGTDGIELGTTRIESTATSTYPLGLNRKTVAGEIIRFRKDGVHVGDVSVTANGTTFNTSSDARLKDVTGQARGLDVINALNPVAYNWKADGKADEGLIAQEVLDIVPNAVSGSEEDCYKMDYSKLVVHLVAGMKEQQEQIESLKSEIANLKGE